MKIIELTDREQRLLIALLAESREKQKTEAIIQKQENEKRPQVIDKRYDQTVYQIDYQLLIDTIDEIVKKIKE